MNSLGEMGIRGLKPHEFTRNMSIRGPKLFEFISEMGICGPKARQGKAKLCVGHMSK